jgi:hypothetical protein
MDKTVPPEKNQPKDSKLTRLLQSIPLETINKRFMVKISVFDNGVDKKSIMVVIVDLLNSGFTIRMFDKEDTAARYLDILKKV